MVNLMRRMGPIDSRYLYRITTTLGLIEVDANDERGARLIAERNGYVVVDVQVVE